MTPREIAPVEVFWKTSVQVESLSSAMATGFQLVSAIVAKVLP